MPENQVAPEAKVEAGESPKVIPAPPVISAPTPRPELDHTKSHKERIAAFLEAKKGAGTIKLNDFLKALFPIPKGPGAPGHTDQGAMRKLRQDLREMKEAGEIRLVNDSYERLGDAHFPDQTTGKTHYWDVATLPIEAVL